MQIVKLNESLNTHIDTANNHFTNFEANLKSNTESIQAFVVR